MRGMLLCAALAAAGLTACQEKTVGARAAEAVPQAAPRTYDLDGMIAAAKAGDEAARSEPARAQRVVATAFASMPIEEPVSSAPVQVSAAPAAGLRLTNIRTKAGEGGQASGSMDLYGIGRRNAERARATQQQAAVEAAQAALATAEARQRAVLVDDSGNVTFIATSDELAPSPAASETE